MPNGQQVQVPESQQGDGQPTGGPPQGDKATLPSNPFPEDGPEVPPPQENPDTPPPTPPGQRPEPAPPSPATAPNHQGVQPPAAGTQPQLTLESHAHAAAQTPAPSSHVPGSLLDRPAQPATVTIHEGQLLVRADNSSLTQILTRLAAESGMKIDGLEQDSRVFGSYGPGSPRDVLASLLDGANYNVLMVGATGDGAPRELILTPRDSAPAAGPQPSAPENVQTSSPVQEEEGGDQNMDNQPPAFVAPPGVPMAPAQQQAPNGAVKTPAQILQELEQMRRQQQQTQQQSPSQ